MLLLLLLLQPKWIISNRRTDVTILLLRLLIQPKWIISNSSTGIRDSAGLIVNGTILRRLTAEDKIRISMSILKPSSRIDFEIYNE